MWVEVGYIPENWYLSDEDYRTVETVIPLGSEFESGEAYTVVVNDVTETFVAQ